MPKKGYKQTEEHKKNLSLSVLGILLVVTLMSSVMAIQNPTISRPYIKNYGSETNVVFNPFLSILVDKEIINLGESAIFTINMSTTLPDKDYYDGTFSTQFAGWVFADKDGKIISSKEFVKIEDGTFSDTPIVKPMIAGEYAMVGLIVQIDQTYDYTTTSWITGPEEVKVKEAQKLNVITPLPPTPPTPGIGQWFANIWNSIIDWFKGLFGG